MAKWMIASKKADFDGIAEKYHITPVLARILRNRDLVSDEEIRRFLNGTREDQHDPLWMKDMEKAAGIISLKIRQQKKIRVIGDYDVDGICSSYLLYKGISALGGNVDVAIPHRMKDGYGLNDRLIEDACEEGVDTILTCDNGIAAAPQIRMAKEKGMTVVVTDHHEVPYEEQEGQRTYILPPADAVVDPKQPGCSYPFKQICGAVVAGKLIQVLMEGGIGEEGGGVSPAWEQGLREEICTFETLATICDVMELRDENRILVKEGLQLMGQTANLGLKALLMVNGIEGKALTPYHVGFIIGPCMNASGRLDTAQRALELFCCGDWKEAVTIAGDLKSLNDSRKLMTERGVSEAICQVEEGHMDHDRVLVIYLPDCHESLAGIIAGRIREKYGKPTFVLTKGEEGIKGSGRSIENYSMYEEMSACKELFTRYGGHKMAAGLSLADEASIGKFRKMLNKNCKLAKEDFEETVHIDVAMPLRYADKNFIRELSVLEPFGVGNPKPVFARKNISLLSGRKLGQNRNVGKYQIAEEAGSCYEMIYFGDLERFDRFLTERFGQEMLDRLYGRGIAEGNMAISMAYYPEINYFAGRESVQIVMQDYC